MGADLILLVQLIVRTTRADRALASVVALGLGAEGAGLIISLAAPFLLKFLVDRLAGPSPNLADLSILAILFVLTWTAPNLLAALKLLHTYRLVEGLVRVLSEPVMRRQTPKLALGEQDSAAAVASALERLPFSLDILIDGLIWRIGPLILQMIIGIATLGVLLPVKYAIALGLVLLAYALAADVGGSAIAKSAFVANEAVRRVGVERADSLLNALRVHANGALEHEQLRFEGLVARLGSARRRFAFATGKQAIWQYTILSIGLLGVVLLAATDVEADRLPLGDFILVQALAFRFALPLGGLAPVLRQAAPAFINLHDVLALGAPDQTLEPTSKLNSPLAGPLQLRGASHQHSGGGGISDVSLTLELDQVVAIVGENGSGKSTLARIMAGLLPVDEGSVWVGGFELNRLSDSARARTILYAPQQTRLFKRSLLENGLYPPAQSDPPALMRRLMHWRFETGHLDLDRNAGETGAALSGGQAQKLELARLASVEAPILILDETTSALDPASEAEILRTLKAIFTGRLLILITHRRDIAESADYLLVVQAGKIAAQGSPEELKRQPAYQAVWMD